VCDENRGRRNACGGNHRPIRLLTKKGAPQRELVDVNEVIRELIVLLRSQMTRYSYQYGWSGGGSSQVSGIACNCSRS